MVQQRRQIKPEDVTPLIEQIAILVRLGMYSEASELLEIMFDSGMEQPDRKQLMNMDRVRQMVDKAAKMEKEEIFRPQNPKHSSMGDNRSNEKMQNHSLRLSSCSLLLLQLYLLLAL